MRFLRFGVFPAVILCACLGVIQATASTYVVRPGDSLWRISRAEKVDLATIERDNRLANPDLIYPGERLTLPDPPAAPAAAPHADRVPVAVNPPRQSATRTLLIAAAHHHGVNPALVLAVGWWESGWTQSALSRTGAIGMMQIEPYTAAWAGPRLLGRKVNLHDPVDNAELGAALLRHLLDVFDTPQLAIAAYYQGEAGTRRYGIYSSSHTYVNGVWSLRNRFNAGEI